MTLLSRIALGAALVVGTASLAFAQQQSSNAVSNNTDWTVFVDSNPTECWSVSTPKEVVNTRNGQAVSVTRGQILLMVVYRPSASARGQVAFTGGYPFRNGSTVRVQIGDANFDLVSDGEWAWPASAEDDARLVAAMKRGAQAVVTAVSSRGTQTRDTFSLLGFTAAVGDAEKRCS